MDEDERAIPEVLLALSQSQELAAIPLRRSQRRLDRVAATSVPPAPPLPTKAPVSLPLDSSLRLSLGAPQLGFSDGPFAPDPPVSAGGLLAKSQTLPFSFTAEPAPDDLADPRLLVAPLRPARLHRSRGAPPPLTRSRELRVSETLGKASAPPSPEVSEWEAAPPLRSSSRIRTQSGPPPPLPTPPPTPPPPSSLSYEEKKSLAAAVVALDPDGLSSIMDLIREYEPSLLERGDEGFQFDLMDLQPGTVAAIKQFVDGRALFATIVPTGSASAAELDDDDPEYQEPIRRADLKISGTRRAPQLLMRLPSGPEAEASLHCSLCRRTFTDRSNYNKHMRTHEGAKPFVCQYCGKPFRHTSTLRDHENIHKATKPYKCSICGKEFSNMANVKRHERTHTDSKPFSCVHCGRAFNQSSNCKQHENKCGGSTSAIKRRNISEAPTPTPTKKPRLE